LQCEQKALLSVNKNTKNKHPPRDLECHILKLVGYCRVSSLKQAKNTSLEGQETLLRSFCDANGHELVHIFQEAASGLLTKRNGLSQAICLANQFDGLLVARIDRLSRSARHILEVIETFPKILVVVETNLDFKDPMGKMVASVLGAVAEFEAASIGHRTRNGRKAKAGTGGYAFGAPGYGYKAQDHELVEEQGEQTTLKLIRQWYKQGQSMRAIARNLIRANIPTKRGGQWSAKQVGNILRRHGRG
jgi:DNA invertase Pin-like site-specific DNA recombinase